MDISKMTLEERIGQLFIVTLDGPVLTDEYKEHFLRHKIGNFIYFASNLTDYQSIRRLSDSLQQTVKESCGIPAFISVDQEGGMVTRAYSGATHFPSNMALTAAQAAAQMPIVGQMVGKELRALGMNLNHAPILDVNNNSANPIIGIRSYADNSAMVSEMGCGYILGLQKSKVMANAKHFPGHGDTHIDSHLALPSIDHNLQRLEEIELAPFKAAIAGGVDSIMSAHIIFKAIDSELPATLSYKILTGLLRETMGFEGLIITDSMSMDAIKDYYTMEKGCVMAINAGADLLCLCALVDTQRKCYEAVLAAAKSGEIPMSRINDAVERIIKYKEKYELSSYIEEPSQIYPEHEKMSDDLSEKSVTLVKGNTSLLPIVGKKLFIISPPPYRANIADDTIIVQQTFCKRASEILGQPYAEISVSPAQDEIESIIKKTNSYETVLYATYNAMFNPGQVQLFKALKQAGKKVILVTLRVPYDYLKMQEADVFIASYEYTNRATNNTIKALLGEIDFMGVLPVSNLC